MSHKKDNAKVEASITVGKILKLEGIRHGIHGEISIANKDYESNRVNSDNATFQRIVEIPAFSDIWLFIVLFPNAYRGSISYIIARGPFRGYRELARPTYKSAQVLP